MLRRRKLNTKAAFILAVYCFMVSPVFAQNRQTDKDADGLKGPVKSVVTEVADYKLVTGESVEQRRILSRSVTYDAKGNWLEQKEYDQEGRLQDSLIFGFIDKGRVATSDETAIESPQLMSIRPLPRGQRVDPRFSYRFSYRYDAKGNRIEEVLYHSTGSLYLRRRYLFRSNRKVLSIYSANGRLNQRYEFTLDGNGNEVMLLLNESAGADKIGYQYIEFDSQGNWTKRIVTKGFKFISDKDFPKVKPWSVEYRTITYH